VVVLAVPVKDSAPRREIPPGPDMCRYATHIRPDAGVLGLLMVRRIEPPAGLALPSGYIEHGERWQDAGARELEEETGVRVDPAAIREWRVRSGDDGTLLVFATVPPVDRAELDGFRPSAEVSELVVVSGPREDVVFPLDADVVAAFQAS
jgi:8-oxo-dGTP pyrophosphatase MutT (NUDIX family)